MEEKPCFIFLIFDSMSDHSVGSIPVEDKNGASIVYGCMEIDFYTL